jgi:hypothetical protein
LVMPEEAKTSSSDLNPELGTLTSQNSKEDHKAINRIVPKTRVVCAINERELNKVELAYFKRPLPLNAIILSDR